MTLSSLQYLPHHERQSMFYTIMECDKPAISKLTGPYHDWKFVAATGSLWAKTTSVSESVVKALLLCFMICSRFSDEKLRSLRLRCIMLGAFRKSQRWLDVLHLFVKWQVIYHTAWTLNALLMEPMCVFSPAFLYNGQIEEGRGKHTHRLHKQRIQRPCCVVDDLPLYKQVQDIQPPLTLTKCT